jgi:KUP system potassium uptake protein
MLKILSGGWVVVALSITLFILMMTWRRGRRILHKRATRQALPMELFIHSVKSETPQRVPGTAIFLTGNPASTPRALLHNFKHNKIIHEQVILLSIVFEEVPYVETQRRMQYENLGCGIHRVELFYGFFEDPEVPAALKGVPIPGWNFKPFQVTYFLGRESMVLTGLPTMGMRRKQMFRFLSTNALDASEYFHLPATRVIEIGLQVEM